MNHDKKSRSTPNSIVEIGLYYVKIRDTVNIIHSIPIYPFKA